MLVKFFSDKNFEKMIKVIKMINTTIIKRLLNNFEK
jgi:hypothetical protein